MLMDLNLNDFIREYDGKIEDIFPQDNHYTFLVGAGVSMPPPTNLPSARVLGNVLLKSCVPPEEYENLRSLENLRYERIAEAVTNFIDNEFNFLDYLKEVTEPNNIHIFLSKAIKEGNIVATTNFDYLIEYSLLRVIPEEDYNKIIPVITKEDFSNYNDPLDLVKQNRYPLYKLHGSKLNIMNNKNTKDSLVTTMIALGKDRDAGETFAIEGYKKEAVNNLMEGRSIVVMGYSGSDFFDISPTLEDLTSLKRLIWIDHTEDVIEYDQTESIKRNVFQVNIGLDKLNSIKDLSKVPQIERLLLKISSDTDFDVILIKANTMKFIEKVLSERMLFSVSGEIESYKSRNGKMTQSFEAFLGNLSLYRNISELKKYQVASNLYFELGQYDDTLRISDIGLKIAEDENLEMEKTHFYYNIALVHTKRGDHEKAKDYVKKTIELTNQYKDQKVKGTYASIIPYITDIAILAGRMIMDKDEDKALEIFENQLQTLGIKDRLDSKVEILNLIGEIYFKKEQYEKSLVNYEEALKISENLGYHKGQAEALNNIGNIYEKINDLDKALINFEQALELANKHGYLRIKYYTLMFILTILDGKNEYSKAIEYCKQMIPVAEEMEKQEMVGTEGLVGSSYQVVGTVYKNMGHYDEAMECYTKAISLNEKLNLTRENPKIYSSIGECYFSKKLYEKAIENYEKSLKINEEFNILDGIASNLSHIAQIYITQANHQKSIAVLERLVDIRSQLNDLNGKAEALSILGLAYGICFEDNKALQKHKEALKINEKLGKLSAINKNLSNIGNIYFKKGDYNEAVQYYEEVIKIYEKLNDFEGISDNLNMIGDIYNKNGDHDKAIEYYEKAMKIGYTYNIAGRKADGLFNIGLIYEEDGKHDKAFEYLMAAFELYEKTNNFFSMSSTQNNIGNIFHSQGLYEKALEHYKKCIEIEEKVGVTINTAAVYLNIGIGYKMRGKYDLAIENYNKGFEIANQKNWDMGKAYYYYFSAMIDMIKGNYTRASEFYDKALQLANTINSMDLKGDVLINIGELFLAKENYDQALNYCNNGLEIVQNLKYIEGIGYALCIKGRIYLKKKEHEKALENFEHGLQIGEQLNKPSIKTVCLNGIAEINIENGNLQRAYENSNKALKISEKIGLPKVKAESLKVIGNYYMAKSKTSEASEKYKEALSIAEKLGNKKLIEVLQKDIKKLH